MISQWSEQLDFCYRCCTTWGETVIRVQCDQSSRNTSASITEHQRNNENASSLVGDHQKNKTIAAANKYTKVEKEEKAPQRELGFS